MGITWTPLARIWFASVAGLSPELVSFALLPVAISALAPAIATLISWQRGVLVHTKQTRHVSRSVMVSLTVLVTMLVAGIGLTPLPGAVVAAVALSVSLLAEWGYVSWRAGSPPRSGAGRHPGGQRSASVYLRRLLKRRTPIMDRLSARIGYWAALLLMLTFVVWLVAFVAILVVNPLYLWTDYADFLVYNATTNSFFAQMAQAAMLLFVACFVIVLAVVKEAAPAVKRILARIAVYFAILCLLRTSTLSRVPSDPMRSWSTQLSLFTIYWI